jgi:hypothetical protein
MVRLSELFYSKYSPPVVRFHTPFNMSYHMRRHPHCVMPCQHLKQCLIFGESIRLSIQKPQTSFKMALTNLNHIVVGLILFQLTHLQCVRDSVLHSDAKIFNSEQFLIHQSSYRGLKKICQIVSKRRKPCLLIMYVLLNSSTINDYIVHSLSSSAHTMQL